MKRLILLCLLLLPSTLFAETQLAWMNGYVAGSGYVSSTVTYTDCSQLGSNSFAYFADYSGDTDKACKQGGTVDGTLSGTSIVASGTDPGTASPTSGGNVAKLTSTNYVSWPITAGDIIDTSEGQACMDVYLEASAYGATQIARRDSSNEIHLSVFSNNTVRFYHVGNGSEVSTSSSHTVSDATWIGTRVCVRWSVSNNKIGIKVGDYDWEDDSDDDTVTDFASPATAVYLGYFSTISGNIYFDNYTISKTSGY